jgi:hypothetical protein
MSDYSQVTNFTAKDALSTGDPEKTILGSDVDAELSAISTAIGTKYDSTNRASTVEARALSSNTVLITPSTLNDVLTENGGMLGDIQALADPNADTVLGWDDSAGAVIGFTFTDGLAFGDGVITLEHLGFENMEDPGADRIAFWDDSESKMDWLVPGNGLETSTTNLQITDVAASTTVPVGLSSGAPTFDITALTAATIQSDIAATDTIVIDDGGAPKKLEIQEMGMRVQTGQATQTLAAADMNSIMEFTATATLTLPLNATTALPVGVPIVLNMKHASQVLTVTADTSVTLVSVFHPGGGSAASDTVNAGGSALLYKTAADVWCISGDIST